jgi:hypothetical protein
MRKSSYLLDQLTFWGVLALMSGACAAAHPVVSRTKQVEAPSISPQREVKADHGTLWVIFIDDLHLNFQDTGRLRDLFATISKAVIREGDSFAIVSTGPSALAIDATTDPKRLDEARARISGAGMKPSEILADSPETAPSEVRYRAHVAFDTAYGVLKMLQQIADRRKAFIYISNGYNIDVRPPDSPPSGGENPFSLPGNKFSAEQIRDQAAELTRQAKRAKAAIFGIDPRALSGPAPVDVNVDPAAWQRYWTTTRTSLQVISEQSAGFVVQDDLAAGLTRILRAVRDE